MGVDNRSSEEEKLYSILKDCLSERCAKIVARFYTIFYNTFAEPFRVIMKQIETELFSGIIMPRRTLKKLREITSKYMAKLNEKASQMEYLLLEYEGCFLELIDSRCIDVMWRQLVDLTKIVKKYNISDETLKILDIVGNLNEDDIERLLNAINLCFGNEYLLKFMDAISIIQCGGLMPDAESKLLISSSGLLLAIEGLYRPIVNFLVCFVAILDKKYDMIEHIGDKGLLMLGVALRRYLKERFSRYEDIWARFYYEDILNFRNAFAHGDYDIDIDKERIILRDKGKEVLRLSTEQIRELIARIAQRFLEFLILTKLLIPSNRHVRNLIITSIKTYVSKEHHYHSECMGKP